MVIVKKPEKLYPETQAEMAEWKKTKEWKGGKWIPKEVKADELGEIPKLPDVSYEEAMPGDANGAVGKISTNAKAITTSTDILLKRIEALEKERETTKTEKKGWLEKLTTSPEDTYEEKRTKLMEELGIPEETEQFKQQNIKVAALQGDLDKLELQQREEIDRAYDRPTAMPNIKAEISEINRDYDRKKAYKAVELSSQVAILQAYQGNLSLSYDSLDIAIKSWMWDYEENRKRWEIMYTFHADELDDLNTETRRTYDMAYNAAIRDEEQAKKDADYKKSLWVDAANKGVYLNFDEILDMSKDEATKLYAKKVAPVIATREARKVKEAENWADFLSKSQRLWLENEEIDVDTPEGVEEAKIALQLKIPDNLQNKALTEGIPIAYGPDKINIVQAIWEGIATNGDEITKQQLVDTYGEEGRKWWDTWTKIMREEVELDDWATIFGLEGAATTEGY